MTGARGGPTGDGVQRIIVDGMNVIGSRPTGWWRDRDRAKRNLIATLQDFADASGARVTVVLDGRPLDDVPEGAHGAVDVLYAPRRGRDAADDRIVELVEADDEPAALVVITSDRALRERVELLGARVVGSSTFLRRVEEHST
ncbi:MAG: NYN domain-containing protein [Chloroflexi bacterium]|nr:NYN domain-containing protein [Chloroflexota bacterium]